MKKNIYTQTVNKITVPDELLNSAIENIRNADNSADKVININKPKTKSKIFRLTGSVAAVLAVIIAFGAVFFPGTSGNSSFVLKANAAELSSETYIKVGNLEQSGQSTTFSINNDILYISDMSGQFNLDIQCEGDNIETITYTTDFDCGYFVVNTDDVGFISYAAPENSTKYGSADIGCPATAKSCVFDYNNQPASRWDKTVPEDGIDGTVPLCVIFCAENADRSKYIINIKEYSKLGNNYSEYKMLKGDYQEIINSYFDSIRADYLNSDAEIFKIDITATFADGTTETQTLQFRCEYDGEDTFLTAKIV